MFFDYSTFFGKADMVNSVEVKKFSYRYPDGTEALMDIDLTIEPGQRVALIGPNGAGKSTLLLAMGGFLTGTGVITVDGIEVNSKNKRKVHATIGSVLQDPDEQLFMPTLFDDVAFGPLNMGLSSDEVTSRVEAALETVGLADMARRQPHHLSAGRKRAAAIATILAMDPKIITMDEPEASLDPRHRGDLARLLLKMSQTMIIATCDMKFVERICEISILLDDGKVIAQGPTKSVLNDSALMTKHGLTDR